MMRKNKMKYLSLCIFIVLVLTACTNNSGLDTENSITTETGIDLDGTYDQNDLLITTLEKEYENNILEIPQIEGLKDTRIQEKVNRDIYERVKSAYKEIPQLKYVTYNTMANFCNVISIGVYIGGEAEDSNTQIYLNYNLVNGNRLTFEELFLADTDVLQIVRSAFREMLIKDRMQGNYDENELYKIVKGYSETEDKLFAFTPSEVSFYYKDYSAYVKMFDIADEVSIYSKYVTKDSLFNRDDIGRKDIFTCVNPPEDAFDIFEFGFLEDNFWYDITAWKDYSGDELGETELEQYMNFKEGIYSEIYDQIENYREIAKNNPERFYIFLTKPMIYMEMESEWIRGSWKGYYTEKVFVKRNIRIFEMSKETYDNIYKDKLVDAYRYGHFVVSEGIPLEATEDVIFKEISEPTYYNYITGEQIIDE